MTFFKCFLNITLPKMIKSDWGDWNRVSCPEYQIFFYSFLLKFPGILCDKPKNSRDMNLTIVALEEYKSRNLC